MEKISVDPEEFDQFVELIDLETETEKLKALATRKSPWSEESTKELGLQFKESSRRPIVLK